MMSMDLFEIHSYNCVKTANKHNVKGSFWNIQLYSYSCIKTTHKHDVNGSFCNTVITVLQLHAGMTPLIIVEVHS